MVDEILILAVDDDDMNVEMLDVILSDMDCKVLKAGNGLEALQMLENHPDIDIMLIDLEMPVMDGYECISQVKQGSKWHDIPVVAMSGSHYDMPRMLALRANDFISKPFNSEELRLRVMNHIRNKKLADLAKEMNSVLESEVVKKAAALKKALDLSREAEYEISLRLGKASEFRDQDTGMHTRRISELSRRLGQLAGLPDEECETLHLASPLHDVGKIGIPDRILLKPGKLDETEFDIMKLHTVIGGKILSESKRYPTLESGGIIALQHHEKWDGSGYPGKLKGDAIHIFARIVMVVDVFDALTSERPYKKAFTLEKTISIMTEGKGEFFDPTLLEIFFEHIDDFVLIKQEMSDTLGEESPLEGLAQLAMM
jgi:putative two-component system response regulator